MSFLRLFPPYYFLMKMQNIFRRKLHQFHLNLFFETKFTLRRKFYSYYTIKTLSDRKLNPSASVEGRLTYIF